MQNLKHKGILTCIRLFEANTIAFVTEPVMPISFAIEQLNEDEICLGFYSLIVYL
jgi:hypothetical protein